MIFRLLSILLALIALPATAKDSTGLGMTGAYGGSSAGLNNATTRSVVRTIKREMGFCVRLESVYRYDCYRQAYTLASRQLNGLPDYAGAQQALDVVVTSLERTMKRNTDRSAPKQSRNLQTFTPIKTTAVAQARKDFVAALDEAETLLLRSADKGNVHYARIAEAVHSNKVLLRALLDRIGVNLLRLAMAHGAKCPEPA